MSPLTTPEEIEYVINQGFRQLHFSNTLPCKKGGLSGKTLIPYTKRLIRIVRDDFKSYNIEIIAGGGVTTKQDIEEYLNEGADHISMGSCLFRPLKMIKLINENYTIFRDTRST